MFTLRGLSWGPPPLPTLLIEQLNERGFVPGEARLIVKQLAQPAADSASLFLDLGSCKFLEGDIDGAIAAWRHTIASDQDGPASYALLHLGLLYEHLHLHELAASVLSSVADRAHDDILVAEAAMALARCQQSLDLADDAMETMARLAHAMMAGGANEDALAEALYGFGEVAFDAGRNDRAQRAWRVASAGPKSPAQQAASEKLVRLLLDDNEHDVLVELIERQQLGNIDGQAAFVIERAAELLRSGKRDQARSIAAAIGGADLRAQDRFSLGEVRLEVGLVNEAIDEFEALLADASDEMRQRAGYRLGEVYRSYDMADVATTMFDRVVASEHDYWAPKAAAARADLAAPTVAQPSVNQPSVAQPSVSQSSVKQPSVSASAAPVEQVVELSAAEKPVVVVLSAIDDDREAVAREAVAPDRGDPQVVDLRSVTNPYAVLAPEEQASDVRPSTHNPYAELSPEFEGDVFEVSNDVEPGDWESLIEPAAAPKSKPKPTPSAFSRYT